MDLWHSCLWQMRSQQHFFKIFVWHGPILTSNNLMEEWVSSYFLTKTLVRQLFQYMHSNFWWLFICIKTCDMMIILNLIRKFMIMVFICYYRMWVCFKKQIFVWTCEHEDKAHSRRLCWHCYCFLRMTFNNIYLFVIWVDGCLLTFHGFWL